MESINKFFGLKTAGSTIQREFIAGLTTFFAMAYILFVNPEVLGAAHMNTGAVFTATAISAAFGTIVMGLLANYPIAIAPGLGMNAFFAYSVVLGMKIPWQTAMAGVFIAAVIFLILTFFHIREIVINAIPREMKLAIAAGIGLFIAFIGLHQGGLIVSDSSTVVALGSLSTPTTWLTIFGLIVSFILIVKRIPAAIFIGMVLTSLVGLVTGLIKAPSSIISLAPSLKPTFGQALSHLGEINSMQLVIVVLTFLLVAFFDTAGTLVGLAEQAGFLNEKGEMPRVGRALFADSSSVLLGSILGTSPTSTFIESSAGIAVGGRTGLTSVFVGFFFLLSMLFSPLLGVFTSQVTAPALIVVGVLMAANLGGIDWNKLEIAIPAFLIVIGMPLTYSISDGIALGFVIYPITMLSAKRGKEINVVMWILALVFLVFFYVLNN
ncbi:AGZA family xanthine/uracil permease-like MFS transporter [Weissella beninensis]|uniref:NCS2 family permease n=1 Tax=Periweissella beninensis TaxID=504936 RepID=A0ABT0VN00_9LACO|nr:NCS2 family permease [Periweissella beninensis]MBM7543333.1 AGZA family xanthine/uracil permease-like MFS transporter [Periweissella beninensis]MCM2437905.1 NCS2 family permease [Periweissella beninensis]